MQVMFLILMISLVAGDFDPDPYLTRFPKHVVVKHPTKKIISIQGPEGIKPVGYGWFTLGSEITPDTELTITWRDGSETYKVKELVRENFLVHRKIGTSTDDLFVPTSRRGEVLVQFHGNLKNTPGFVPIPGFTHWYYATQFDISTALMAGKRVELILEDTTDSQKNYLTHTVGLREMNLLEEGIHSETIESDDGRELQITVVCDELEPYPQAFRSLIHFVGMGITSVTGLRNIVIKQDWVELDQEFVAAVDQVELTLVGHKTQIFTLESWKLLLMGRHEVKALVGTEEMEVSVICGKQLYALSPLIYTLASTPGSTMVIGVVDDSEVPLNKIEIRASVEGHQVTKIAIKREELGYLEEIAGPTYYLGHREYSANGDTHWVNYQDIWDTSILVVTVTYVDNGTSWDSSIKVKMSTLLLTEKTTFEPAQDIPALTLTTRVNLEKVTYLSVASKKELFNSQLVTRVINSEAMNEVNYPVGTMSMTSLGLGSTPVFASVRFLKGKLSELAAGHVLRAEMTPRDGGLGGESQVLIDLRQMTKTTSQATDNFNYHTISSRPPLKYLRKRGLWVHFVTNDGKMNHVSKRIKKWLENHARFTIRNIGNELSSKQELDPPGDPDVSPLRATSKGFLESIRDTFSWRKKDIDIYVYTTGGEESDVKRVLAGNSNAHFIVLDNLTAAERPPGTNVFTYDILPVHGLGFGGPSLTPEQSMQQAAFKGVFLGKLEKHIADLGSKNYPKRARRRGELGV